MELGQRRGGRALNPGRVQPGPPYNSRPSKPFSHQPIDREKTCPLLLRVFTKVGAHHTDDEFSVRGKEPKDEVQIYTWKDATLRELTDLVKEVAPEANKKGATLSFAFVYPCKTGRLLVRQVGRTFSNPDPRRPDNGNMSLRDYDFEGQSSKQQPLKLCTNLSKITSLKLSEEKKQLMSGTKFAAIATISNKKESSSTLPLWLAEVYDEEENIFFFNDRVSFSFCPKEVADVLGISDTNGINYEDLVKTNLKIPPKVPESVFELRRKLGLENIKVLKALDYRKTISDMPVEEEKDQYLFKQLMCYYILENFLMCGNNEKSPRAKTWKLVADLDVFDSVDWAGAAHQHLMNSFSELKKDLDEDKDKEQQHKFMGCTPILEAILFKRVPALVPESKIKNLNPHPPIQKYGPIRKEYEAWKDSLSSLREKQRALGHEGHKKHRPAMLLLEQHKVRQEHFSHPNHPLILIADEIMIDDATCYICNTPVRGTCTYICPINDIDCRNFYLHMSCAELPREIYFQNHKQHCAFLKPCSDCVCDFCGVDVNFGYACGVCSSFIVCVFCASEEIERTKLLTWTPPAPIFRARDYSYRPPPKVEHFSHPKHTLRLVRESDDVGEDEICHLCNKPVIGSPTYTCSKDAIDCERFYLHKACADLPMELNHSLDRHLLGLMPRPDGHLCAVCASKVKYAYACDHCNTNVCVFCGFEQRVIYHEGHHEHNLTLQREAEFKCDACSVKAQDYSYVCTPCDFWIHKTCAFAPSTIPAPAYHHHPLSLIYSIPEMHRYFSRNCAVCSKLVERHHWLYYCHKCTFFVHIKCSTSKYPLGLQGLSVWFANDIGEPNLVQFPLSSKESLFGLIVDQCRKLQIDFQGEGENSFTATTTDGPHIIEEHWSHPHHQLKQLHFTENDDDMDSDNTRVLICDGCIQPITAHHPCYYSCVRCEFLLHSFCATKLPRVFPSEAFPSHPNHSLVLQTVELAYIFVKCGACNSATNGFYYHCETCDMTIDIRCAFLPSRIKHESHKHHSLVQCPPSNFICSASKLRVIDRVGYACKSCPFFRVDILCAFYPSSIKHRYDDSRDITLRHPPFFHEGVIYCEICEEQVNNQWWLYHCSESAHSYHHNCLQWHENVKLRSSIVTGAHTLSMVFKRTKRRNSPRYICRDCNKGYKCSFLIECDGCGLLVCLTCFYNFMALCFPGWVTWAGILRRAIKP